MLQAVRRFCTTTTKYSYKSVLCFQSSFFATAFSTLELPQNPPSVICNNKKSKIDESYVLSQLSNLLPISSHRHTAVNSPPHSQLEVRSVDEFLSPEDKLRGVFLQKLRSKTAIHRALGDVAVELNFEVFAKVASGRGLVRLVGDIERIVEVHSRSNDFELLDYIKRLENEIRVLKEKNKVVEDGATGSGFKEVTYTYDEGHTKKDVDEDLNRAVESLNEVVDNEEKEYNVDPESLFRVVVDEVQMNTSSIVKNVPQRKDRLKKIKNPDYITPPSTTPKRKKKQHSTQFLDVDDIDVKGIAESAVEESYRSSEEDKTIMDVMKYQRNRETLLKSTYAERLWGSSVT